MSSRWFHSNINGEQAENILLSQGVDGSFLVRPSESKVGNFTISVRYRGEVNHIKVVNDGDSFCLAGSPDPFATLSALVQNYMEIPHSIKEKRGGFIELLYPIRSNDPTTERWYHGRLGSKEAERLLLAKGRQGSYLVRESQTQPGKYVLAVKCKTSVHQIIIKHDNGMFEIAEGPPFNSLRDLIEYFVENQKLRDIKDQSPITLSKPYQSTSFLASKINERIEVLCKENSSGMTGYREEFELLYYFDQNDGVYTMHAGNLEENKPKNRYKNILPYDHSRVLLKSDPKEPQQDYINANYINSEVDSMKYNYIATQGPLNTTISDFWMMVYQHNSTIILMLTNETEQNKVKCAKYWPDFGESIRFNKLVVENMLENSTVNFTRRELQVSHVEKGKKAPFIVYQYHYTQWRDHDVPSDTGSIIGLLSEIHTKQSRNKQNPPVVIHCSAGIGRTGTIVAIDILMHLFDELGIDGELDIQKTCQLLRTQRSGMIQTELQYQLIYQSLKNYIEAETERQAAKQEKGLSSCGPAYKNLNYSAHSINDESGDISVLPAKSDKPVPKPPTGGSFHESVPSEKNKEDDSKSKRRQTEPANAIKKPWKSIKSKLS